MPEIFQNKKFQIITGIVVILIIGLLAIVIFNGNNQEPIPEQVQVEITWWNLHNNPVYQEVADDFAALYEGQVRINIVDMDYNEGEEYYKNLIMNFAKGTAPDIFTLRNESIPAWREEGFIAPIRNVSSFTTGQRLTNQQLIDRYRSSFVPIVQKETTFRDEIYAITNYVDNLQMYYNPEILSQAGIAIRPRTWRDFDTQVQSLNQRNIDGNFEQSAIAMGTGLNRENGDILRDTNLANFYEIIPALIFQWGSPIYDDLSDRSVFGAGRNPEDIETRSITAQEIEDDDPSYAALRYFTSFVNRNSNRHSWDINIEQNSKEAFLNGQLAYSLNYKGFEQEIRESRPRLRFGITEIPQLDRNNKKTYGRFFADVMNSHVARTGQAEDASLEEFYKYWFTKHFLHYLSESQTQEKILGKTRLPAARFDLIDEQQKGEQNLALFASGNLYADTYFKPNPKKVRRMWGNLIYRIHYENIPLKESLRTAIQEYDILIQKGARIDF